MEEDKFIGKPTNEWHAIARGLLTLQSIYLLDVHENGLPNEDHNDTDMAVNFISELASSLLKK